MSHDFVAKELNHLFDDLVKNGADCQQNVKPRSDYDKIVTEVAEEFSGGSAKTKSRNKEIAEIKVKIGKLKRSLKKNRNIRNHRLQSANKKRADKRASLNTQIKELEQTLKYIDMEKS